MIDNKVTFKYRANLGARVVREWFRAIPLKSVGGGIINFYTLYIFLQIFTPTKL